MKHQTLHSNATLEDIEKSMKGAFPDVKIFFRKGFTGRYLVVQKTALVGVGIRIKNEQISVTELIPSPAMAGLLASFGLLGIAFARLISRKTWKEFNESVNIHIAKTFCVG